MVRRWCAERFRAVKTNRMTFQRNSLSHPRLSIGLRTIRSAFPSPGAFGSADASRHSPAEKSGGSEGCCDLDETKHEREGQAGEKPTKVFVGFLHRCFPEERSISLWCPGSLFSFRSRPPLSSRSRPGGCVLSADLFRSARRSGVSLVPALFLSRERIPRRLVPGLILERHFRFRSGSLWIRSAVR